jgi:hypothetical protein
VLRTLCGFFEIAGGQQLQPEVAELIVLVIELLRTAVAFMHRKSVDCGFPAVVAPAILAFFRSAVVSPQRFKVEVLVSAARVLSSLAVDFGAAVVAAVDEQLAASLVHDLKSLLASGGTALMPVTHELIVLFGLLCRWSPVFRESCRWLPPPALLTQLCNLPLAYFVQKEQAKILVPTIVACCLDTDENARIVLQLVSGILIAKFIREMTVADSGIGAPQHRIPVERRAELAQFFTKPPPAFDAP